MWDLARLKSMDPEQFEYLVADLFEHMGYAVHVTPHSRDGGVDIVAKIEHLGLSHTWLVQVKRYSEAVGVREVREYGSLRFRDNVDGVIIVTTGHFSPDAQEEAGQYNVKLIGGQVLVEMLKRYHPGADTGAAPVHQQKKTDVIMRHDEVPIIEVPAFFDGHAIRLTVTSKNLFIKDPGGLLGGGQVKQRIPLKNILGFMQYGKGMHLVVESSGTAIHDLRCRKLNDVIAVLDQALAGLHSRRERLVRLFFNRKDFVILTNRRLITQKDGQSGSIDLKDIIGMEPGRRGFLSGTTVLKLHAGYDEVQTVELKLDDAISWKQTIEKAIRG